MSAVCMLGSEVPGHLLASTYGSLKCNVKLDVGRVPRTRHIAALRTCTTRERRPSTAQEATETEPRDQEDEGAAKVGGRAGERRGTVWRRKESGGRLRRTSAGVAEAPGWYPAVGEGFTCQALCSAPRTNLRIRLRILLLLVLPRSVTLNSSPSQICIP